MAEVEMYPPLGNWRYVQDSADSSLYPGIERSPACEHGDLALGCAYCTAKAYNKTVAIGTDCEPRRNAIPELPAPDSIDTFLAAVKSSCTNHADRKGYHRDGVDVASSITGALGLSVSHALCEIAYKIVEFQATPRRVVAEKIAGWAFMLWLTVKE